MRGKKRPSLTNRSESEASWSSSEIEDDKDHPKTDQKPEDDNNSYVSASPRQDRDHQEGNNDRIDMLDPYSDIEVETSDYRSPIQSRLSYSDYGDDYDDEDYDIDEELMEILIETLTGTTFRVRVSSRETGAGLKALLYRTEGLPANQQHLLLGQRELLDELGLGEQGVGEGSVLRLVVSLKGGPVNARRALPHEDVLWKEVTDIMDEKREEIWESVPGGRAVTLLVLRDGDSVNLYRVVEHEDGSFSPLSQSWGSSTGGGAAVLERSTGSRAAEDEKTETTMADLRAKMTAMRIRGTRKQGKNRSAGKKRGSAGSKRISMEFSSGLSTPPAKGRFLSELPLELVNDVTNKTKTIKAENRRHKSGFRMTSRMVVGKGSRPSTQERSIDLRRTSVSRTSGMLDDISHSKTPRMVDFTRRRPLEDIKPRLDRARLGRVDEYGSGKSGSRSPTKPKTNYASYRQSLVKHGKSRVGDVLPDGPDKNLNASLPRREGPPVPFYMGTAPTRHRRDVDPLHSSHNFDRLRLPRELDNRPKTSPEVLERRPGSSSGFSSERIQLREPDEQLMDLMNILNTSRGNARHANRFVDSPSQFLSSSLEHSQTNNNFYHNIKTPLSSSVTSVRTRGSPSSKPSTPGNTTLVSSATRERRDLLRTLIKSQVVAAKPSSRKSTPEKGKKARRPVSGLGHLSSPSRLPPVTPSRKKRMGRRPRCAECNRRIYISTTYSCRCERSFCAQHRYAETHACTYDYKTEGRKLLQMSNPLVEPQKLPKI